MNSPQVDSIDVIEAVKQFPFLYDRRIKCSIRDKANKWTELGALFGLSGHVMQTRWTVIRDKYTLLKRRAEAYPGTRLGQQIQSYKYANALSFLDDSIPPYNGMPPKNRCKKKSSMNKSWEKSHTLLVIKQLSNYPLLYDKTHPYYNHCLQRMAAYRKISDVVKRYNSEATPDMISKKIRTIRTQFAKEKREQRNKKLKPGAPYVPKLWFYNRLRFLDEKRTYDSSNLNGIGPEDEMEVLDDYDGRIGLENDSDEDDNRDTDVDDDDEDEEYNDAEEWISLKESTKPFEQVELFYADEANVQKEVFEGEIEGVFDQKGTIVLDHQKNQTRNDLYAKCTGLLDSLAKQIKPYESDTKTEGKNCNCKNCPPSSLLGKMIESELTKVSEPIYIDAKWKIIRILEEAQRKSLREKQAQKM